MIRTLVATELPNVGSQSYLERILRLEERRICRDLLFRFLGAGHPGLKRARYEAGADEDDHGFRAGTSSLSRHWNLHREGRSNIMRPAVSRHRLLARLTGV